MPDEFSADELTYLNSKGGDGAALERAYGGKAPEPDGEPKRTPTPASDAPKATEGTQKPAGADEGDDADEGDEDGQRPEHVPHGRFHKERERRRHAETEAADLKVKMARAEERLAILNELALVNRDPAEAGDKPGDKGEAKSAWDEADVDPLIDFEGAHKQLLRRQREDREARTQERNQDTERQRETGMAQNYARDALAFQQKEPAFKDAYQHLMKAYHRELEAFGIADVGQRNQHIRQEEQKLARWSQENGKSPAEVIWNMAHARGWQKPAAEPEAQDNDPSEKIDRINRAQKSSTSLSNVGGGGTKPLTMDQILNLSDDDFYEKIHKLDPAKRRKVLAG